MTFLEHSIRNYMLEVFNNVAIVSGKMELNMLCSQGTLVQMLNKLGMADIYYQGKSC